MSANAAQHSPIHSVSHKDMANAIRALTLDAVKQANSGHSGMPMGMADVATVLFSKFMKFDPAAPLWPDRDRFVLSAGHGSMLLYALAYLTGYEKMTLEEIKNFRQLGALTAGHPEVMPEIGVETTTGPLGQGLATAVGFALAERMQNLTYGRDIARHFTYVMAGDGCMQEGISHEACSLAGHLGLGKLIVFYDDNGITIDGPTSLSFTDNTVQRFEAYGWETFEVDGHDPEAIAQAITKAQINKYQPSLISCKTRIGYGAPTLEGTNTAHGAITDDSEIAGTRENLDWPHAPFDIPDDVLAAWRAVGRQCQTERKNWQSLHDQMEPDKRAAYDRAQKGGSIDVAGPLLVALKKELAAEAPKLATRAASGKVLAALVDAVPELVGGSADLTGSNNTLVKSMGWMAKGEFAGRYIYYGVREHAMAAIMNGLALHRGFVPYGGTFLCFSDYARAAMRLSALMRQQVIYVMTHDSIGLGEDGPTHQPVEHLAALRAIPHMRVFRPADAVETAECWQAALDHTSGPTVLALTRQGLPTVRTDHTDDNLSARGAYILVDADDAKATIWATGSEVSVALAARDLLAQDGVAVRVVSAPCLEVFFEQSQNYQDDVRGSAPVHAAIEAGVRLGWDRIIGPNGVFIGMDSFGESAPAGDLFSHFKITAAALVSALKETL